MESLTLTDIISAILKALRYLGPFLKEAISVHNPDDPDDIRTTYNLRKFIIEGTVKILGMVAVAIVVFYSILPIYTENVYLKDEVKKLERDIVDKKEDLEQVNQRNQEQKSTITTLSNSLLVEQTRYKERDAETQRLSNALHECREDASEYRALLLQAGQKPSKKK